MVKKLFFLFLMVVFSLTLTLNTPLLAQEETSEDIEDFSLEELLNVEITTAGKQAEKVSEIPASVVLVTRDDIEKFGYQSLEEVLENIPGLYQVNDYLGRNLGVRGFWSIDPQRNVIVLINNIKQAESVTNAAWLQQINIPVEAIDRIEVVRGPMSVIYGTGAFFGVINIKTNVVTENPINMVSASIGSEKTYKTFVRASGKEGDFQYSFNGSYYDTNGFDHEWDKIAIPAVLGGLGVTKSTTDGILENTEKFFNFSGNFKGFSFNSSYTESKKEDFLLLPSVTDGSNTKNKVLRVNFGYTEQFSDKVKVVASFGYYLNKMLFHFDLMTPKLYSTQNNQSSGYSAELNLFIDPSPNFNITFGLDYQKVLEVKNEYSLPAFDLNHIHNQLKDGESIVTQAVYTQLNYRISEKFKLVVGARVEQTPEYVLENIEGHFLQEDPLFGVYTSYEAAYTNTKAEFIPRVALIYSLNEKNFFKFLYGKAINRPSFFQSMDLLIYPGSESLKPESIQTFELNYMGNLSSKMSISMSLFHNMLDKLIFRSLNVVGGQIVSSFANVGEMTTTGAEMTIKVLPVKDFHLELSGTYQDTKDKRDGLGDIEVGYSPKFLGYLKAYYLFNENVSLAVTGNYVSDMESYYDATSDTRLGGKVDGYFLLGANLRLKNLFGTGLFLNLRGSNLLDKEFHYPVTSNSNGYVTEGTIGRGMSFLVTVGWLFK
jgi:outer membrane receptor protein involved in Fe transport